MNSDARKPVVLMAHLLKAVAGHITFHRDVTFVMHMSHL